MRRLGILPYYAVFVIAALTSCCFGYYGTWFSRVRDCLHDPIAGTFLAYCQDEQFGDFEHGAYFYGLEPKAEDALKGAEVLFVGSSVTQFAFSTRATETFFDRVRRPFYLLGFGYGEQGAFFNALKNKLKLNPKVLVVSVDPFFSRAISKPAKDVASYKAGVLVDYAMKYVFEKSEGTICRVIGPCDGTAPVLFRDWKTGKWIPIGMDLPSSGLIPISQEKKYPFGDDAALASVGIAKSYLSGMVIRPECIVLTGVPNSLVPAEKIARSFSRLLGYQAILPEVSNLSTFDGHHLDPVSAERWSDAFLLQLSPVLDRCIHEES